jgi:hypothetical protein
MTISELQAIAKENNSELIEFVKNTKRHSGQKMFRILLLEDQGLLEDIKEVLDELEKSRGSYTSLKKEFLRNNKSQSISELMTYVEQGYFSTPPPPPTLSKTPALTINQLAGKHIKAVGSAIYEYLILSTLLLLGWFISIDIGTISASGFAIGYFIYGIYTLIWIIRLASNLSKAGSLLMNSH